MLLVYLELVFTSWKGSNYYAEKKPNQAYPYSIFFMQSQSLIRLKFCTEHLRKEPNQAST